MIPANGKHACGDGSGQDLGCGEPASDEGLPLEARAEADREVAASGQGTALGATSSTKVTFDVLGRQFLAKYSEVLECPKTPMWEETAYCFTHAQQCALSAPAMPGCHIVPSSAQHINCQTTSRACPGCCAQQQCRLMPFLLHRRVKLKKPGRRSAVNRRSATTHHGPKLCRLHRRLGYRATGSCLSARSCWPRGRASSVT